MKILINNPEKFQISALEKEVINELNAITRRYTEIVTIQVSFGSQTNYTGHKKSCTLKINTSGPKFLVSCYEETLEKALHSSLTVLKFQLRGSLDYKVA